MDTQENQTLQTQPKPMVSLLQEEFRRCGQYGDAYERSISAEETRLCRWDGQSDDGKKWDVNQKEGQKAFPWNGATDSRVFQADGIINEQVAIQVAAFWRSDLRVQGVETNDLGPAAQATTFMDWLRNSRLKQQLEEEVEYSAQYTNWHGWCSLHTTWEREIGYKTKMVRMDDLINTAQELAQADLSEVSPEDAEILGAMSAYPELISLEDQEDQAIEVTQQLYLVFIQNNLPPQITTDEVRPLSKKEAKRIVRDLRENGQAEFRFPHLCKNQPCITAQKPWRDIVVQPEATSLDGTHPVFIITYEVESDIRNAVVSDGWDKRWVEQAVKTKGQQTHWSKDTTDPLTRILWGSIDTKSELIEVVTAYHRAVDEDGVVGLYYTVFSPHVFSDGGKDNLKATQGLLSYPSNTSPCTPLRRERLDRSVLASRGVSEVTLTSQKEEKINRDSLCDLASVAVMPPINVYKGAMGQKYKFGPAVQNEVTVGKEPQFMNIPTSGSPLALEHIRMIQLDNARYFGRFDAEIPPSHTQLMMEQPVRRFLSGWGEALKTAYMLYVKYAPEIVEKVTGMPLVNADDINAGGMDFVFHFDVAQLNPDMMAQKMDAFSKLLPEDREGVLDSGKLIAFKARMIDPAAAKELVTDRQTATQKMIEKVQNDLVAMFNGNPPNIGDASNDPTAQTKLQIAVQTIGQNQRYIQALEPELLQQIIPNIPPEAISQGQPDPLFSQFVKQYLENLQMGAMQQQNKQVGRTGVKQ